MFLRWLFLNHLRLSCARTDGGKKSLHILLELRNVILAVIFFSPSGCIPLISGLSCDFEVGKNNMLSDRAFKFNPPPGGPGHSAAPCPGFRVPCCVRAFQYHCKKSPPEKRGFLLRNKNRTENPHKWTRSCGIGTDSIFD